MQIGPCIISSKEERKKVKWTFAQKTFKDVVAGSKYLRGIGLT
jgi:hypothetical protein